MAEFRVLGPMELRVAGEPLDLGPPKQRLVLAALLLDLGRPVTLGTLVDRVWDTSPPAEARNALYVHVARIRRMLTRVAADGCDPARLERRGGGYLLDLDADRVDLHRFRHLVGRAAGRPDAERVLLLREALGLWRGPLLAGLGGEWAQRTRDGHGQQLLAAAMSWAQVELRLGNHETVLDRLPELIDEHPLVEPLTVLLMRALHAGGRSAEALNHYSGFRRRLADELGTDPGPELRELYGAILRGGADGPAADPPAAPPAPPVQQVPAQLPPDLARFTGRERELAQLDAILAGPERPGAVIISAIFGTAGVGKTTLAVHWAYRNRDRFPDGQLYVNLRGFDPASSAMSPAEAIRGFLDAYAVPPERVPASLDGQIGLYRSILADRRVLVVLDNARDADQVRPLLPGSPSCLVLATSRNRLTGLVATEGAHPLALDLLTPAEARQLLAGRLGAERIAAEPAAVDRIIEGCSRLPLALAIVAARAATPPWLSLAALADELQDARGKLDALAAGDATTNVRAVFQWSYRTLSQPAARLFRLLGLHPGPDIGTVAAASLAGVPVAGIRPLLAELAYANLVSEHLPGRFTLHDLLHAYAAELAEGEEPDAGRDAARRRLFDHYLHAAHAANRLLDPHRHPITIAPAADGVTLVEPTDRERAMAWFTVEHAVLVAVVVRAGVTGFDRHTWQLTWALTDFFEWQGYWHDWHTTLETALAATRRTGDRAGEVHIRRGLASAHMRLGRYEEALVQLRRVLEINESSGEATEAAYTHRSLARLFGLLDRYRDALGHAQQALRLYRAVGHRAGQARALNNVGWDYAQLGDHEQALAHCQQALILLEELGDRYGQANTWDSIGYAYHHLGRYESAVAGYRRAIELYQGVGDRYNVAETLSNLGDAQLDAGWRRDARTAWEGALEIFDELTHPEAVRVRDKLHRLDPA